MSTEESVGIAAFSTRHAAFAAVTKQRWSDFLHEVTPSGRVVELVSIAKPAPAAAAAAAPPDAAATEAELASSLGAAAAAEALALNAGGGDDGAAAEVVLAPDEDKERRRAVHQLVKRLLPALCSDTVDRDGGKCVRLLPKRSPRRADGGGGGKRQRVDRREEWPAEAGGRKHLGFTLYKENRDTHDALAQLARAALAPAAERARLRRHEGQARGDGAAR